MTFKYLSKSPVINFVEVFKTNVDSEKLALKIIRSLTKRFPHYKVNFDLDDCDNILRIESKSSVNLSEIIDLLEEWEIKISILKD